MKTLIIASGIPPSQKLLQKELISSNIVIAVDGGVNCLWKYNITPNYIIGDLDSANNQAIDFFLNKNISIEQHPCNKNDTDAQLALNKAHNLDTTNIVFLGCLGGKRTDHLFGAFGLLKKCCELNIDACLKDDIQTIFLLNRPTTIKSEPKEFFSLQAYSETVSNLTITGSKYELKNYELKLGDTLTLSNEFQDKDVKIEFTNGKLLLFRISNVDFI